jgi:hypothetical protein
MDLDSYHNRGPWAALPRTTPQPSISASWVLFMSFAPRGCCVERVLVRSLPLAIHPAVDKAVAVPAGCLAGDCVTVAAVVYPATASTAALTRMIFLSIFAHPRSLPLCASVLAFDPYGALHFSLESLPAVQADDQRALGFWLVS